MIGDRNSVSGRPRGGATRRSGRCFRLGAVATVCALALSGGVSIQTLSAAAALGPYVVTLPDLQIQVPTDAISVGTNPTTGDRQLQFTHITWDAGRGPFQIKPRYSRRTGTAIFHQTIYKSRGGTSWRPAYTVPVAVTGTFDPPSDYRFPLTRFTLNQVNPDGSLGNVVATSPKTDYCITADAFVGGVPNTPNNTSPPQSNCTNPHKALGFSVGWGDEYDQTDNGQPIDLSGVPDGTYVLHAMVDPLHVFTESDPNNNVTDTVLQIAGNAVTIVSQTNPTAALPEVGLANPTGSSTNSDTMTLLAHVKPPPRSSIESVQFLLDGEPLGAPSRAIPYVAQWTIGNAAAGTHVVSAQVTDSRGDTVTAPVKTVDVISRPGGDAVILNGSVPKVLLVNPIAGQSVSGTVPVSASVTDPASIRSVQFLLDGRPLGHTVTVAPYAVRWDTTGSGEGPHLLSVQATNVNGTTGVTKELVDVTNPAPPMTCFVLQAHVSAEGRGSVTTPKFHTASAGETLVAFVSLDGQPRRAQTIAVSGGGLSWRMVRRAVSSNGHLEVWTATAPRVLVGAKVRSHLTGPQSEQHISVIAMEGVDGIGASAAASSASGSPTLELRTTKSTSLLFAVADQGNGAKLAPPPGWVQMDNWMNGTRSSDSWTQFSNQPTGTARTVVQVRDGESISSPWNLVVVELVNDGG